jgi:predicted short-subunit dehydrogenase-like oxidoreductase (DUF2520 family)
MSTESVAIVGAGAVGTALAHALSAAGISVTAVASRQPAHAEELARATPGARAVSVPEAGRSAPIVILTVSDSAIEDACAALDAPDGALVAHVSGSRDVSALEAARANGADVGGMHPLAAVARGGAGAAARGPSPFDGAVFAVEGDEAVTARLSALASALGGHPFSIAAADKPLYHLGASMLAAFAAGLSQLSWEQLRRASASDAVASRGVAHLLRTVADNIGRAAQPAEALTGPAARGDPGGVARQAAAARSLSPEAYALYRAHARHNIAIAQSAGAIAPDVAERLLGALREDETTGRGEDET